MRSALAVPLEGPSGVVGVMTLYRADSDAFSRDQLRILQAISSKVSVAIENALIFQTLEDSAAIDYLSELPNARSLFLRLDSDLARCKRNGEPLCVVVCDLDGFKQVNDRFGHMAGNKVLRLIANGLREQCGSTDFVARMGGDEFVILSSGGSDEELDAKIDRMRNVAKKAGDSTPEPSALSMSVGVAIYPEDGKDAEDLLAEADRRMYKSKRLRKKGTAVISMESPPLTAAAS
jgi:diguanylate cyclase (GGDEF)-like protein